MNHIDSPEEKLHPMQSPETIALVKKLDPFINYSLAKPGSRFYFRINGVKHCYFLRAGLAKLHRDEDEIMMTTLPTPYLLGISNLSATNDSAGLFIETINECLIASLTIEEAKQLITEQNAWELLSGHLTKITSNLFTHYRRMTAPSAYEIIRFKLLELMQEPQAIRESISAANYILYSSHLSRSAVMKILAQLKQGKYIEIENGVLKSIHHLPKKY
ncbi:hypothetical protein M976_03005 [Buttiauxella ferragutiae ATCC 51602]|jgi:hypothetical protein|uniref:IprA winged helix-turn-helix domain-containing protein n=1 Tax=Buttiauxella ferragutiae ATCC 51602 TaxID=1354252 RepID=A0ABX2W5W7_9ENTR|nr:MULTISPECIES: helix-turn-helix domain-containing protein [Buttiauxella]OAT26287.1 hypothetical protein M976_03005 [Buttiauxella ferragutiae ATCC 51602]UNK63441.1 helix-turn-helix domain-containing protein [Buttiauxella ferragutiae]